MNFFLSSPRPQQLRGGHWGVPNTAIPYEKLANTEIRVENGRNTDTAFMIGDAYLTLIHLASFFFFISSTCTPEINLSLREKT